MMRTLCAQGCTLTPCSSSYASTSQLTCSISLAAPAAAASSWISSATTRSAIAICIIIGPIIAGRCRISLASPCAFSCWPRPRVHLRNPSRERGTEPRLRASRQEHLRPLRTLQNVTRGRASLQECKSDNSPPAPLPSLAKRNKGISRAHGTHRTRVIAMLRRRRSTPASGPSTRGPAARARA